MTKSIDTDKQCLQNILLYMSDMKDCFSDSNINSYQDLEQSKYAKYTVTQLITNINELSKKLQTETLNTLNEFKQIDTHLARNIASHNYEKVNFKILYRICSRLTADCVFSEVRRFVGDDSNGNINK